MIAKSLGIMLGLAACGVFAGPAVARTMDQPWNIAVTSEAFDAQVAQVRAEMQPKGRYDAIGAADRAMLDADFARISELLRSKESGKPFIDRDQLELANAQERVNAILTRNDGDRLICKMEQRTGTNFKQKVCMTARQREEITRKAQEGYQRELMKGGATQERGN